MIGDFGIKELVMLYSFLLRSYYLAAHTEKDETLRLILKNRNLLFTNKRISRKDGKYTRKIYVKNGEETISLSFPEMVFLRKKIEERLFHIRLEPLAWGGGEDVRVEVVDDLLLLTVVDRGDVVKLKFSSLEHLQSLRAGVDAVALWDAPYPIHGEKFSLIGGRTAFSLLRIPSLGRDIEIGTYPYVSLSVYADHILRTTL